MWNKIFSLNQNKSHGLNMFVTPISTKWSFVTTRARIIMITSRAEPDSGVTITTGVFIVSKDPNSCSWPLKGGSYHIETFLVTVMLQRCLWSNKLLPRMTTERGATILPVSDQWHQRIRSLVYFNKSDLMTNLHSKTDRAKSRFPIGRQLCFLWVEPSHSSSDIKSLIVTPQVGIVMKCSLRCM